jgi:hypothetical protein
MNKGVCNIKQALSEIKALLFPTNQDKILLNQGKKIF